MSNDIIAQLKRLKLLERQGKILSALRRESDSRKGEIPHLRGLR
jgi:hypothetical protein